MSAGLGCGPPAPDDETFSREAARLDLDLARGRLRVTHGGASRDVVFEARPVTRDLERLRHDLAGGARAEDARRSVGTILLAPADSLLAGARRWQVRVAPWPAALSEAAMLGALIPPWTGGAPVVSRHALEFEHSSSDLAVDTTARGDRMLLLAPFRAQTGEVGDDADTLRVALRRASRALDLVPRNDADAEHVSIALAGREHAVLWVRATPRWWLNNIQKLRNVPPVVVWSLPSGSDPADLADEALPRAWTTWPAGARAVFLQLWPCSEESLRPVFQSMASGLAAGLPAAEALARAQAGSVSDASPRVWASWIVLGDGALETDLRSRSWLD